MWWVSVENFSRYKYSVEKWASFSTGFPQGNIDSNLDRIMLLKVFPHFPQALLLLFKRSFKQEE
jgi:hypothetical protein